MPKEEKTLEKEKPAEKKEEEENSEETRLEEEIEKIEKAFSEFQPSFVRTTASVLNQIAEGPQITNLESSLASAPMSSISTSKEEDEIKYSIKDYVEKDNKDYQEVPDLGMAPSTIQTQRVDVMNLGKEKQELQNATFANPERDRMQNAGGLEQDYVSMEKVDESKLGKENPLGKDYRLN
jgi:hypothetical protein